jgi:uncharacterized phage protein gp47/JayE
MDRYADLLQLCIDLAEEWLGKTVDTSEQELLGHLIRNLSLLLAEINESVQWVYDSSSVSNSSGVYLDNLLELVGIFRQSNAKSTATLTCTATVPTTIPAGSIVRSAANVQFATDVDLVFSVAGSQDVAATCTVFGPYNADPNDINIIVTTVYGWSTATNAAAAIPGRLRELDAALKERHTVAVSTSGERDAASIFQAVSDVTGVSAARVDEDYTSITPVSVYVIGGSDADVATAIDGSITVGIGMAGTTSVVVYNDTMGQNKTIRFTRATNLDTYISMVLTKNPVLYPADGDLQIKNALIAYYEGQGIGEDVNYLALSTPILSVPGVTINELYLDDTPSPTVAESLSVASDKRAVIAADDIVIT